MVTGPSQWSEKPKGFPPPRHRREYFEALAAALSSPQGFNEDIFTAIRYPPNNTHKYSASSSRETRTVKEIFYPRELVEKRIDISIQDNEELRRALIDRIERTVLDIIAQIFAGELPKISYRITSIDTLMDQLESIDSRDDECHETLEDQIDDTPENPDSGIAESLDEETPGTENISVSRHIVSLGAEHSHDKFVLVMTTMAKLHRLMVKNRTETRRAYFYELKGRESTSRLVSGQAQVDRIVNIIANMLECAPWDMALVASAKGLCSGDLVMTLGNDRKIDYGAFGGVLIPSILSNVTSLSTSADLVLVVEKDAVFHELLQENCPRALNCILITGKGYPDVATRMLVKLLSERLELPVYVLVDADPYGIEIMLTYKYGSINLSYGQGSLACPSARWIGVHPSDFSSLKITAIPLTDSDNAKLDAIESRPYVTPRVSDELRIMRRGKAEIEAVIGAIKERDLATFYIQRKILNARYI